MEAIRLSPLCMKKPSRLLSQADGLDVVAVGIEQEGGVVGRAVIGAQPGTAVIAPAGLDPGAVEAVDGGAIGRAEGDMGAGTRGALARGVEPQRRLACRTEPRARSIARAQHVTERRERARVEAHARVEILHLQADMVVHGDLLMNGGHPRESAAPRSWKILRFPLAQRRNSRGETRAAR